MKRKNRRKKRIQMKIEEDKDIVIAGILGNKPDKEELVIKIIPVGEDDIKIFVKSSLNIDRSIVASKMLDEFVKEFRQELGRAMMNKAKEMQKKR